MTPYFKDKSVKLFLGDSLELLKQIPKESGDMIFADPPYNLSNGGFSCHAGKRVSVNKDSEILDLQIKTIKNLINGEIKTMVNQ